MTYGHRVLHGAAPVEMASPDEYVEALRSAFVDAGGGGAAAYDSQGAGQGVQDCGEGRAGVRIMRWSTR